MESRNNFPIRRMRYIDDTIQDMHDNRINNKLSLRKKKIIEILFDKKKKEYNLSEENDIQIQFKYKIYSFLNIEYGEEFQVFFASNCYNSPLFNYLNSNNINEIKNGIVLLNKVINQINDNDLLIKLINCLLSVISKNKDNEIVFNILYSLTNISYKINNKQIKELYLTDKILDNLKQYFLANDFDIIYQIICLLNNILQDNIYNINNLLKSDFFINIIYNFFVQNEIIYEIKYNKNKSSVLYHIIDKGINFLSYLLAESIEIDSNEVLNKLFTIIINFTNTSDSDKYYKCIYSLVYALERDL